MSRTRAICSLCVIAVLAVVLGGCNPASSDLNKFNNYFKTEYLAGPALEESVAFAQSRTGMVLSDKELAKGRKVKKDRKPRSEDLLWTMQLGCLERLRQNHKKSTDYFDKSEEMLNYFDQQNQLADSVAKTLVNENVVAYLGTEYDGIMVNTYKALNFMTLGQRDLARVEFNRALDRQRRAVEKFAKEVQRLKEQIDQEEKEKKKEAPVKKNIENPKVKELIAKTYPGLYEFKAYPDFVNPFATYMAGVFFNLDGDYSKAAPLLKESYGMVSDNEYIAQDLADTEKILNGAGQLDNMVWVIFENGLGPVKEEFRIDIPLFMATNKVRYVGIALPKLVSRAHACPHLSVKAGGYAYTTQLVADMDRVIQTEFNKDFKGILARTIISATTKAVAQYALQEEGSQGSAFASIFMAVYSLATTAADVRIWTTLPRDFQVARLSIPADRCLTIVPPGAAPFEVKIPPCKNALVYVRMPFNQARAVCDVITY